MLSGGWGSQLMDGGGVARGENITQGEKAVTEPRILYCRVVVVVVVVTYVRVEKRKEEHLSKGKIHKPDTEEKHK